MLICNISSCGGNRYTGGSGNNLLGPNALTANVEQAKKQKAAAAAAYNKATLGGMVYNEKATNDLLKATNRVDWAKEKLSSEKVKEKLNVETKEKSKHRLKLEEEYRSKGMSEEEAAVAACCSADICVISLPARGSQAAVLVLITANAPLHAENSMVRKLVHTVPPQQFSDYSNASRFALNAI